MHNILFFGLNAVFLVLYMLMMGCATAPKSSADADKRYWEAIEADEARRQAEWESGERLEEVVPVSSQAWVAPSRDIEVSLDAWQMFFAHGPAHALGRVVLKPVRDGVELIAYEIVSVVDEAIRGVDIRRGDFIVGVNGQLPRSPDVYFKAWEKAKDNPHGGANLTVQRGTDIFEVKWKVKP